MEKHSLWASVLTVLANLVSKFVTQSRIIIRDPETQGYVQVTASAPFQISEANITQDGIIHVIVSKSEVKDETISN